MRKFLEDYFGLIRSMRDDIDWPMVAVLVTIAIFAAVVGICLLGFENWILDK